MRSVSTVLAKGWRYYHAKLFSFDLLLPRDDWNGLICTNNIRLIYTFELKQLFSPASHCQLTCSYLS